MTVPRELEVKILRLYQAEKWPIGTIASQLAVHHTVVRRVLEAAGIPRAQQIRPSILDPYVPFVIETWKKYPKLPASRLYAMCVERGYPGKPDYFRQRAARYRPKPPAEAYLRLRTLPGEQAQVDWGHFGKIEIGRASRSLVAFVMVLSWSRAIYLRFYLGQQSENFLRGHEGAFAFFAGSPRVLLYDNLKSAVLERVGAAIRFNPLLLDFASHYHFEPRPVAVARGNEKGRVERAIRYVRSSFFLARKWKGLDDLNAQALAWCRGPALARVCPEDKDMTVGEALESERGHLLALPDAPFPTDERREVRVGKTPYARFDTNDYSVPHAHVRRTLVVVASEEQVRILDGTDEIARHPRSYDRGQQIEDPSHVAGLVEAKRQATKHRAMDRLAHAAPAARELLVRLAERGANLGNATQRLVVLLDTYGAEDLEQAVREVLQRDVIHVHGVRQVLERERRARGQPPATPLPLPDDPRVRGISVRPHDLGSYDLLATRGPEPTPDPEQDRDPDTTSADSD